MNIETCVHFSLLHHVQYLAMNAKMEPLDWWVGTQAMRVELRCVKEDAGALCALVTVGGAHWMQL